MTNALWQSPIEKARLSFEMLHILIILSFLIEREIIDIRLQVLRESGTQWYLWGEWLSGLSSLRQVTEVKLGRVSKLRMGDLGGLTSQITSSSFRRDVKLGVPCLDAACTVGLN